MWTNIRPVVAVNPIWLMDLLFDLFIVTYAVCLGKQTHVFRVRGGAKLFFLMGWPRCFLGDTYKKKKSPLDVKIQDGNHT